MSRAGSALVFLRRFWWWALALVAVLGLVLLRTSEPASLPYDPNSTASDGLRALALLTKEYGGELKSGTKPEAKTVLVLSSRLGKRQDDALKRFVTNGGTALIASSGSNLSIGNMAKPSYGKVGYTLDPQCNSPYTNGVRSIQPDRYDQYSLVQPAGPTAAACFPGGGNRYFMVVQALGRGTVIQLGGPNIFTNGLIGSQDNSVLAMNLLGFGEAGVEILEPDPGEPESGGDKSLGSLISENVKGSLWQLAIAAVVLAIWRARRLGAPVVEDAPNELRASQLVVATGDLMHTASARNGAVEVMRSDLRRSLAELLAMSPDAETDSLVAVAANRARLDPDRLRRALLAGPPSTDAGLIALSQEIEYLHQEVARAR